MTMRTIGHLLASERAVMSSVIAAVRQIASGLGRRAEERFCLIYELRLVDTNGYTFVPSAELTERDVIDRLTEAGYGLHDARRLIRDARLFFTRCHFGASST
jgi:hypothetical protein